MHYRPAMHYTIASTMSLYAVERPKDPYTGDPYLMRYRTDWFGAWLTRPPDIDVYDASARDGEWHAVVTLPHEVVEHDGYGVPVFEGDVERIEWEARRRR